MHVNKYYTHRSRYPANSDQPFHKVTHRHDKSIPGCTLAPREGIYRPVSYEQAVAENTARFRRWAASMQEKETRIAHFSGDRYNEPIYGAYGEKL